MTTAAEMDEIRAALPEPTPLERLQDAVAVYFGDQCPVGSCSSMIDAQNLLAEAAHRAMERSP